MNSENLIWQLIARSISGEASAEEMHLLQNILKENELLQQQYDILKQFWHSSNLYEDVNGKEYERNITILLEKTKAIVPIENDLAARSKRLKRKRREFFILFGTAMAVIFLSTGLYFFNYTSTNKAKFNQVIAQNGSRSRTILPDGSTVWLNAGSTLSYINNFTGKTREVYLKGEAFFDVVKKPGQPFIVHANSVDIKVLGTAFNVKSYAEDNQVEATLIRGVIQVIRQDDKNQKPVFLHPNEKLVISLEEKKVKTATPTDRIITKPLTYTLYHLDSTVKTENLIETSWMYNRLEFRGDSFKELAKKLERWYNINILFEDSTVEQLNFNGSFENETIDQAFAALKTAVAFDYTIDGNEIFVRSAEAKLR